MPEGPALRRHHNGSRAAAVLGGPEQEHGVDPADARLHAVRDGQVTSWTLAHGDVVVFRGDQKHGYRNPGTRPTVAYSVVAFAPVAT